MKERLVEEKKKINVNNNEIKVESAENMETSNEVKVRMTRPCLYCGEAVWSGGEERHVRERHLHLAFQCRLCPAEKRTPYPRLEDVLRHLDLRHQCQRSLDPKLLLARVVVPGARDALHALGAARCAVRDCRFSVLGEEVHRLPTTHGMALGHSSRECRTRGFRPRHTLQLALRCRLCSEEQVWGEQGRLEQHLWAEHGQLLLLLFDQAKRPSTTA